VRFEVLVVVTENYGLLGYETMQVICADVSEESSETISIHL
jgi:hypothetical protein